MDEPTETGIGPEWVGREVQNAAKLDWGVGKVLRVQRIQTGGGPAHRVTVHFKVGTRTVQVPPARLIDPEAEPTRKKGWLDTIGGSTLDDTLRRVPEDVARFLGSPEQRFTVLLPLFAVDPEDGKALAEWARRQTRVADPLTQWSRDELDAAFGDYCVDRDSTLRNVTALVRQQSGPGRVRELLADAPGDVRRRVEEALGRVI